MTITKPKSKPVKMRYHNVPLKWRPELNRYVLDYLQSGCTLSVRQYCRNYGLSQSLAKRYLTKPMRDWCIATLLSIKSIDSALELHMSSLSRKGKDDLGVYADLFPD